MRRNLPYLLIGLLALAVVIVGYLYYQERQGDIDIEIGKEGVRIEGQ